ncbi:hypothetical protein OKW96_01700 [Sphingobacterium sp. KU25419]|nr:hypothetical protein OKW96_01700 [Sphingobacterium sp. KU25419]
MCQDQGRSSTKAYRQFPGMYREESMAALDAAVHALIMAAENGLP